MSEDFHYTKKPGLDPPVVAADGSIDQSLANVDEAVAKNNQPRTEDRKILGNSKHSYRL